MSEREAFIDGIALWTPALPGWNHAAPALRGVANPPADIAAATANAPAQPARPAPTGLAANERRRAPDSVLVALQVAEQAVAMSGHAAATMPSVFTSAHGDLPIIDALARTLAGDPRLLSPTRFHHSVHNAASGYWAIGSGSRQASTALAGGAHSFAAGLLEAMGACIADQRATLLVGFDTEARGPLASVNASRGLLGVALVLAPRREAAARWRLHGSLLDAAAPAGPAPGAAAQALAANAQADALPLFAALARGASAQLGLALSDRLHLALTLQALQGAAEA